MKLQGAEDASESTHPCGTHVFFTSTSFESRTVALSAHSSPLRMVSFAESMMANLDPQVGMKTTSAAPRESHGRARHESREPFVKITVGVLRRMAAFCVALLSCSLRKRNNVVAVLPEDDSSAAVEPVGDVTTATTLMLPQAKTTPTPTPALLPEQSSDGTVEMTAESEIGEDDADSTPFIL